MKRFDFFKELGFSDYEARLLSSFVKLRTASPKELSVDSSVPQNKIYSILRGFENQGMVSLVSIEPKKYQLINLDSFVNCKIREKQEKLKELKKAVDNLEETKLNEEQFVFSLIKGQKAIMNKLVEVNKNVEREILGVQRNWKYWGEGIRGVEEAIRKGVNVKFIGIVNEKTMGKVEKWKEVGCKIKDYNKKFGDYPLRFSIFDNKYARITLGKPEIKEGKDYITIFTDSKPLVNMLRNQFLEMWRECKKV